MLHVAAPLPDQELPHARESTGGSAVARTLGHRAELLSTELGLRTVEPHAVDDEVHLLVVERDQAGDLLALRERRLVRPREVGVRAPVDLDRPVLRVPLYGQSVNVSVGRSRSIRTSILGK